MLERELLSKIEAVRVSPEYLLILLFPQSTSALYPVVVNLAQGAAFYNELTFHKKLVHVAAFARTGDDITRASAIMQYVHGWKGVQVFAAGTLIQNTWQLCEVLRCYLKASSCSDWTAHCHRVIDDPFAAKPNSDAYGVSLKINLTDAPDLKEAVKVSRYIFPCNLIYGYFHFQIDHPASPENQIQATAVSQECHWCPNLDPSAFKKIGEKSYYKDIF